MKEQQVVSEAYLGSGIIYINGRDVGNVSAAKFAIEQETKDLNNYRGGGGKYASVTRISAVTLELVTHNFNQANLALAVRGIVDVGDVTAITDAVHTAIVGGLTETDAMIDISKAVEVKAGESDTVVLQTAEDGTVNYDITPAGILVRNATAIADGTKIKISYTPRQRNVLQALLTSGADFRVVFDGVNEANSGAASVVRVHRFKPNPTDAIDLIGDDFGALTLTGPVLADTTKPLGKSQFFVREDAI